MTALAPERPAFALRRLYLGRFSFAIAWALLLVVSTQLIKGSGPLNVLTIVLLVAYPTFDLVAAVVDRRTSGQGQPSALLVVNMTLSLLTAIGLVVAVTSGVRPVLVVWGIWAVTAGAVQLVVAIRRRRLGGQWPLMLSGAISVLAGSNFIISAAQADSVGRISGYAVLGGIFFLISALRLSRIAKGAERRAGSSSTSS